MIWDGCLGLAARRRHEAAEALVQCLPHGLTAATFLSLPAGACAEHTGDQPPGSGDAGDRRPRNPAGDPLGAGEGARPAGANRSGRPGAARTDQRVQQIAQSAKSQTKSRQRRTASQPNGREAIRSQTKSAISTAGGTRQAVAGPQRAAGAPVIRPAPPWRELVQEAVRLCPEALELGKQHEPNAAAVRGLDGLGGAPERGNQVEYAPAATAHALAAVRRCFARPAPSACHAAAHAETGMRSCKC